MDEIECTPCMCGVVFFFIEVIKVVISLRGLEVPTQHLAASYCSHSTALKWERERERGGNSRKVTFQQILGKTFHSLLPLSALFKHYGPPVQSSRPFESLSRWRGWNASPTKPWLMFKEEIMEIQCHDHTGENQKCFLLWWNMAK